MSRVDIVAFGSVWIKLAKTLLCMPAAKGEIKKTGWHDKG